MTDPIKLYKGVNPKTGKFYRQPHAYMEGNTYLCGALKDGRIPYPLATELLNGDKTPWRSVCKRCWKVIVKMIEEGKLKVEVT